MNNTQPLLSQLVKTELSSLGVSKKYNGFKSLADLIVINFTSKPQKDFSTLFSEVAKLNNATIDAIEHNVKHLLLNSWNRSSVFKKLLSSHISVNINTHSLLEAIIKYIENSIF